MRLLAGVALLCVVACGEARSPSGREEAPPAPTRSLGPPSVPVPQVAPADPVSARFFGDGFVFVTDLEMAFVWDPTSGRVLHVGPMPTFSWPVQGSGAGVTTDVAILRASAAEPFGWQTIEPSQDQSRVWSPTLDAFLQLEVAGRRELVVRGIDGGERARFGVGEVLAQFTSDGARVLTCDERGAELHDAGSGRWLGAFRGALSGCFAGAGAAPIVVNSGDGVVLLDPHTLAPLGEPIASVRAARASVDGRHLAIVVSGSREGISVLELPSRREVFHRSMPAPQTLGVEGGVVAYASQHGDFFMGTATERGGAFRIGGELAGTEIITERDGFGPDQLGPEGAMLVVEEGVLTLRRSTGEVAARYDAPRLVSLRAARGELFVSGAGRSAWRISRTLESHRFGVCPVPPAPLRGLIAFMDGADEPRALVAPGGWRRVDPGCLALDDGTTVSGSFDPVRSGYEAWDARSASAAAFVSYEQGPLVVYSAEGARLAELALDRDERPPCAAARRCRLPIEVSPDGALVAVARGPRLRVFDGRTGARLAQATVGERTATMFFTEEGALLHVDEEGRVNLFERAARGRLRSAARWQTEARGTLGHAIRPVPGGLLEDAPTSVTLRDTRGAIRARREVPTHRGGAIWTGALVVVPSDPCVVLGADDLSERGSLEGSLRGAGGRDVFTCIRGSLSRTTWEPTGPRTRMLELACGDVAPFGEDAFLVSGQDGSRALLRADDRSAPIAAVQIGQDEVHLGARDVNRAGAMPVMLRRPELSAEGMIPAPRGPTLAAWLAPGRPAHHDEP